MDRLIDGYTVRMTWAHTYVTMSLYDAYSNVKLSANVSSSSEAYKAYGTIGRRNAANKNAVADQFAAVVAAN